MIPKLRFTTFNEEYNTHKLGSKAEKIGSGITPKGGSAAYSNEGIPFIRSQNVNYGRLILDDTHITESQHRKMIGSRVLANDVLLNITGASIGRSCVVPSTISEANVNQHVCIIRSDKSSLSSDYLNYWLQSKYGQKEIYKGIAGGGREGLNFSSIRTFKISIPKNLEEQLSVTSLLKSLDQKINLLTKKKEALETYKKGLMQKIFSQELRFKREDGTDYPEWKTFKLSEVLIEHKKRSDGSEQVHSVSVHKGVVNQIEHLGRSFAAKDVSNYNKVLFGDIIYTKSPTGDFPYGIIKQSYAERAIVSPLYCVTSPIDINIGYLLNWFFESKINVHNYLHPIIQKGAKNTINITNTTFLSRSLTLPSDMAERQNIKNVYSSLNDNLRTLESEILKVTEFKKGLLQQMFV